MRKEIIEKIKLAKIHNIVGKKYGKLTVVEILNIHNGRMGAVWLCKCDCGKQKISAGYLLKRKTTNSCGCMKKGRKPTHIKNRIKAMLKLLYCQTVKRRQTTKGWKKLLSINKFIVLSLSPCYYCGDIGTASIKDRSSETILKYNGIDRKDNLIGYTNDNSVSCCKICNFAKHTLTEQEFLEHIIKIYNYRKE